MEASRAIIVAAALAISIPAGPLPAAEFQVVTSGACPGETTITVASASPGGAVSLVDGVAGGESRIQRDGCDEVELDLLEPRLLARVSGDDTGGFSITLALPAQACGRLLQAVDDTTCATSRAVPLVTGVAAPLPRTGRSEILLPRDDGDLQRGLPSPDPRFTDRGDGTVEDHLTGLLWLRDAGCLGTGTWAEAMALVEPLGDGQCGLADGSAPGDWRLPNVRELASLIDYGEIRPSVPAGHPFVDLQVPVYYWTSTTLDLAAPQAWGVRFTVGHIDTLHREVEGWAWAVRGRNDG